MKLFDVSAQAQLTFLHIDPAAQLVFFRALNLRPPRQLEKMLKDNR